MTTILLTGFEPFASIKRNPSAEIVRAIAQRPLHDDMRIEGHVLPVSYEDATMRLVRLLNDVQPDAVLMLGVATKRDAICLERVALNLDDASIPDNDGSLRDGYPIAYDAPLAYPSSLPLDAMHKALTERGIRVRYSNHAGTYVCNHLFYAMCHQRAALNLIIPAGFVHVPDIGDEPPAMPLETMIEAVDTCLGLIAVAARHSYF